MFAEELSVEFYTKLLNKGVDLVLYYGPRLLESVLILAAGWYLSNKISHLVERLLLKSKVDPTIGPFIKNLVYYSLLAAVIIAVLGNMGVNVTSFLTVLGAASLAVGLALKDSLGNFAAGVLLLFFRFFRVGDYVTAGGTSGTVKAINIFNTELSTPDNQQIYVPNGNIMSSVIVNTTKNPVRRLDLVFGIGYDDDLKKAKEILQAIVDDDDRVLRDPSPFIGVGELADSSVNILLRPWVNSADYWSLRCDLLERVKLAFDAEGISIPYPQQDVHVRQHVPETTPAEAAAKDKEQA